VYQSGLDHYAYRPEQTYVAVDGRLYQVGIWDTKGNPEFDAVRKSLYSCADVVLLCFAVSSMASLKNVIDKWSLEADASGPSLPKILVGMKADLRENRDVVDYLAQKRLKPVTYCQGLNAAKELGCVSYLECSAVTGNGALKVIEESIRVYLHCYSLRRETEKMEERKRQRKKKKRCVIC